MKLDPVGQVGMVFPHRDTAVIGRYEFEIVKIFLPVLTYVLGAPKNCLIGSTHHMFWLRNKRIK